MSHYFRLINKLCILSLWIFIFQNFAQEKFQGELTFSSIGLNSGENVVITITASGNKTRWFSTQPGNQHPYLPTSNYGSLSGQGQGNNFWVLHAPDDSGPISIAWGYYTINVQVPSRGFNCTFDLDLRDANWTKGGYRQKYCQDTEIVYSTTPPHLYHQRSGGGYYGVIGSGSMHEIWNWYDIDQNKIDLSVPVTATNNFSGGQIIMDDIAYSTPKTFNWGWTTTHTISVITPETVGIRQYGFRKWSDGLTSQSRILTIDDQHNSYSFTANFWNAYLTGPGYLNENQVGSFKAYPSGGSTPYNYAWYKMQFCDEGTEKSGTEPDAPPCDVWIQLSQFNGSSTATASGTTPGFKMKVAVTDQAEYTIVVEKEVQVGGTFSKSLPESPATSTTPMQFALLPNYPNPFNPNTTLHYQLPEATQIQLRIYNFAGAEIRQLINENQTAGEYQVPWDGKDANGQSVAGGIYLARIMATTSTTKFQAVQKLILLK